MSVSAAQLLGSQSAVYVTSNAVAAALAHPGGALQLDAAASALWTAQQREVSAQQSVALGKERAQQLTAEQQEAVAAMVAHLHGGGAAASASASGAAQFAPLPPHEPALMQAMWGPAAAVAPSMAVPQPQQAHVDEPMGMDG